MTPDTQAKVIALRGRRMKDTGRRTQDERVQDVGRMRLVSCQLKLVHLRRHRDPEVRQLDGTKAWKIKTH